MKRFLSILLLLVVAFVFCGGPPEKAESETSGTGTGISSTPAYELLTEVELQKFMKVFPIAQAEFEKSGKRIEAKGDENPIQALDKYATIHTEIAGLDAKLAAAGMPWKEFWPAYAKVMAATGAYAMKTQLGEGLSEMEAQLKDPKIPAAQKEMMKGIIESLKSAQKAYEGVPEQNINMIKTHWDELKKLFDIED
jgi:hypothetical protein